MLTANGTDDEARLKAEEEQRKAAKKAKKAASKSKAADTKKRTFTSLSLSCTLGFTE